jgi:hypothetical protein
VIRGFEGDTEPLLLDVQRNRMKVNGVEFSAGFDPVVSDLRCV